MITGRNLWELIEARAADSGDAQMAVDEDGRTLTFAEYRDWCERAAAGFQDLGLVEGDVVSWQLPTWFESTVLVGALARLGITQNPIIPIYREREVGFVTKQAGSKLLVVPSVFRGFDHQAMADTVAGGVDALDVLVCDKTLPEGDPAGLPAAPVGTDDPADLPVRWLFYTSGTTADPKGAKHTDASIAAIAEGMGDRYKITPEDRGAMVFPFTHIGGITWLFCSLQFGNVNLFLETFDPATTVPYLGANGVTLAGAGTPFHMVYLAAQKAAGDTKIFPEVRCFPGGGAPKPPTLHAEMKQAFGGSGILSGYGLTEAPILVLVADDDSDQVKAETEGKPMPGVELKLVKLDGSVAGPDEEGEIRAKAPQMMRGYLDSALDEDAFDEDGWFRTGDLGSQDADGNLIITGRLKDIIIRNMENISAKEVEDLLFEHPQVGDAAVIGLPDDRTGERVVAVVVTAEGQEPISFETMKEHLVGKGLRKQALPEQLEFIDILPRNPTGKVVKYELREQYLS
jgi:acyl-CoA synthetase (AMP-forming)/AMP-acid ligase II